MRAPITLSIATRVRLERDIIEIREELAKLATKDDVEAIKRHIDARTADILSAIRCAGPSASG